MTSTFAILVVGLGVIAVPAGLNLATRFHRRRPAGDAVGQLRANHATGEVIVGRSLSRNKVAGLAARPAPTEFVGGLLLAAGLLTRPTALFIVINFTAANFFNHAGDAFDIREKALLFGFIALMYLLAGAGRYSMDALIRRNRS